MQNPQFFQKISCSTFNPVLILIWIRRFVGNGYITTKVLKEILREIDATLSEDNLEQIIEEVDEDGSGTVDFDEFMTMMTGE